MQLNGPNSKESRQKAQRGPRSIRTSLRRGPKRKKNHDGANPSTEKKSQNDKKRRKREKREGDPCAAARIKKSGGGEKRPRKTGVHPVSDATIDLKARCVGRRTSISAMEYETRGSTLEER